MTRTAIVVFSRSPGSELKSFGAGRQRDLRLLEWLHARTLATVQDVGCPVFLATDRPDQAPAGTVGLRQSGRTFEARLLGALRNVERRGFDRIVLVGTDTPGLTRVDLETAVKTSDVFVGPSRDGGFYLIGLCAGDVERLSGLPWGGRGVLRALSARFEHRLVLGRHRTDLDDLRDVDHLEARLRRVTRLILGEARADHARHTVALRRVSRRPLTVRDVSPSLSPPACVR